MRALTALVLFVATVARAEDDPIRMPRLGCDPVAPMQTQVSAPKGKGLECGDHKLGGLVCTQTVGGGGCGTAPPPSKPFCAPAQEACDGELLGDHTCKTEGFAGGTLSCAADCSLNVSACVACFPTDGVTCGQLPGAERLALGKDEGAALWQENGAWRLALVRKAGVVVLKEPVVAAATSLVDVAWSGTQWLVLYAADGTLFERRLDGDQLGKPRAVGEVKGTHLDVLPDAAGRRFAVVLQGVEARPRIYPVTPRGLGPEQAQLESALLGQSGGEAVVVIPILDAGPGEGDLAVVGIDPDKALSRYALFKGNKPFGNSTNSTTELDLGFKAGHLVMTHTEQGYLTTWAPNVGERMALSRTANALPEGIFARHPSVTQPRVLRSGPVTLAVATFSSGGVTRVLTALQTPK